MLSQQHHVLQRDLSFIRYSFFFFNDTATTEIYTLSLHDALPICCFLRGAAVPIYENAACSSSEQSAWHSAASRDRKSTRLNSSHLVISYAVFCLKKKNNLDSRSHHICWLVRTLDTAGASLGRGAN